MTKVKICGITNLADARFASGAGAEYLGFIQHESSPRYISPDLAKDIISWVYGAHPVGVFVDKPADEVNSICEKAGFSFAQLHGSESAAYCEWIDRPIIKAIPVTPESTAESLQQAMNVYAHVAEFLLLGDFVWRIRESVRLEHTRRYSSASAAILGRWFECTKRRRSHISLFSICRGRGFWR